MTFTSNGALTRFVRAPRRRTVSILFSAYFVILFLTLLPPIFGVVNRVQPYIFGLSFMLFWLLFVSVMMAVGLSVLYWVELKRGEVV